MSSLNGDGAFLVRIGNEGKLVLSMRYTDDVNEGLDAEGLESSS